MQRRGWKTAIQQLFTQIYPWSPSINPDWPRVPCTQQRGWKTAIQQRFTESYPSINPDYYPGCHVGDDMDGHQLSDHPSIRPSTTSNNIQIQQQAIHTNPRWHAGDDMDGWQPSNKAIHQVYHTLAILTNPGWHAGNDVDGGHPFKWSNFMQHGWMNTSHPTTAIQQQSLLTQGAM